MYIISSCLLGFNCKYSGGNNYSQTVRDFCDRNSYVTVCPEQLGGLSTPRPPAEIRGGRVVNCEGRDVTDEFLRGAQLAFEKAEAEAEKLGEHGEQIEGAVLKANSPSCGSGSVYDGTFSGKLTKGNGCFAAFLKNKGIKVISEKEL